MWTVVNFQSDNSVAAVPEFWYRNGMCAWPNKFNTKLVIRRAKPNKLEFSYFKSKALFKNIDTYLNARALAQENSDISSNDIFYNDLPKAIEKKSISRTDKNIQISSPPTYADSDESNEDTDDDKTYLPTDKNNTLQLMSDDDNLFDNNSNEISFEHIQQTSGSLRKKMKFDQVKTLSLPNTLLNKADSPSTSQTVLSPVNEYQTPAVRTQLINDELENKFNVLTSALKGIERNITVIKHEIKNFHDRLDSVVKMQETILDKINIQQPLHATDYHYESENDTIMFIDDDATFNLMEDKLLNENLFRSKVVKELSRLCSTNIPETIRKMMQKLFSDEVLSGYSYIGFKGKKTFSTLQTCAVIFESIRKMKKFKDSADIEIEKPIKNWMGQATPRLKKLAQKNAAIINVSINDV